MNIIQSRRGKERAAAVKKGSLDKRSTGRPPNADSQRNLLKQATPRDAARIRNEQVVWEEEEEEEEEENSDEEKSDEDFI
jgi:hypothetical protein